MSGEDIIRGSLAALLLVGASACSPRYETIEVDRVAGHVDADVSSSAFEVPEGGLVVFSIDAESEAARRDYDAFDDVELSTEHPSVARIEQGLATGTWMLMGVREGRTVLEVRINGELEDQLPVDVLAQEVTQ
jgi:hypothetical protein